MRVVTLLIFGFCGASPAVADLVSMADLVGGKTITCGDFKFSKFEYKADDPLTAAAAVTAGCVTMGSWTGLEFGSPWNYTSLAGAVPGIRLAYLVTPISGKGIAGAMLTEDVSGGPGDFLVRGLETKFPAASDCYT